MLVLNTHTFPLKNITDRVFTNATQKMSSSIHSTAMLLFK